MNFYSKTFFYFGESLSDKKTYRGNPLVLVELFWLVQLYRKKTDKKQ